MTDEKAATPLPPAHRYRGQPHARIITASGAHDRARVANPAIHRRRERAADGPHTPWRVDVPRVE